MAARGGIYRRQDDDESDDDDEVEEEPGVISEAFQTYIRPMFSKDKKWFWWQMASFGAMCLFTKTRGLYQLDWMNEYLTKESPLDKAMQTQIPQQRPPM